MNPQEHDDRSRGIPMSAVYQQLAAHPLADIEDYDPAATIVRLMTTWTADDAAIGPDTDCPAFRSPPKQATRPEDVKTGHQPTVTPDPPDHRWRNRLVGAVAVAALAAIIWRIASRAPRAPSAGNGMSGAAEVAAVVLFTFFITGVAAGIIVVIAISARRADEADRRNPPEGTWPTEPDEDESAHPPWWQNRQGK